ncbi:MAG: DEAD/DEAH box helicase [Thermodesulfobacteriota bacterium]|nr:DEAD/DEAH box helicase [Thermodesulfobacteriota bacterium]
MVTVDKRSIRRSLKEKFFFYKGKKSRRTKIPRIKPGIDSRLKKVFSRIGIPTEKPFEPDSFQLKALEFINYTDCLVSAPTGSGKTWIAQEAIRRIYKKGGRAWYGSPLKALTNSKYLEFCELFGFENVGILTGDRKENADAPIIAGTTEILRNQLYDAMHEGTDLSADLVILDEAHFLGDEDRGVVWEEIMIYLPVRIHLLLLSATIKNARQIADWLKSVRSKECMLVEETERPVPLFYIFLHPSGKLLPLINSRGIDKKIQTYLNNPDSPLFAPPKSLPPFGEIMGILKKFDLLPAIFFMKSRADCDEAMELCFDMSAGDNGEQIKLNQRIDQLIKHYPHIKEHKQLRHLRNAAVAAHHSGQLPAWKLIIEHLMTEGLLNAVFATSTVAAGVNFPARCIVFLNSDRFNGIGFIPLNATEFHQMTGRAGRRGKDNVGFAVVVPGKFMDLRLISNLCVSPPEDVMSRIKVDFSMVMNLLLSHNPEEIKNIFQNCFATYLNLIKQEPGLNKKLNKTGKVLMSFLPEARCSGPEFVLNNIRRRAAMFQEIRDLNNSHRWLESRLSKTKNLLPGRLFLDHSDRMYCAVKPQVRRKEHGMLACRVKQDFSGKHSQLSLRWFSPQKISQILDRVIDLPPLHDIYQTRKLLARTAKADMPPVLDHISINEKEPSELMPLKNRTLFLEKEIKGLACNKCPNFRDCHGKNRWRLKNALNDFTLIWDATNAVRMRLWYDFTKHLDFLKEQGFVTDDNKLAHDGIWTSQLRLDQPLMIAECIRKGIFSDAAPALLAALIAPFVNDRERETMFDESKVPEQLLNAYEIMRKALVPLVEIKKVRKFEVRQIELWPAATIYAWARGEPWQKVLNIAWIAEGDLAMLVSRTADNLRQIAALTEVYPAIAKNAFEAIDMIMREPVVTD